MGPLLPQDTRDPCRLPQDTRDLCRILEWAEAPATFDIVRWDEVHAAAVTDPPSYLSFHCSW